MPRTLVQRLRRPSSDSSVRTGCASHVRAGTAAARYAASSRSHGMGEHIGRYAATIDALTSAGLTVYGNDHRGHGHTARSAADLGNFGEGGFDSLVEDMVRLSRIAKDEYPDLPFFLLGHSMGSFAAQQ